VSAASALSLFQVALSTFELILILLMNVDDWSSQSSQAGQIPDYSGQEQ
jgi:hypothetical protein